jgi:hypothetical protein
MNQMHVAQLITVLAIIVLLGVRILRMSREQRFQPARMWFIPALFAILTVWLVVFDGFTTPLDILLMLVALACGFGIGWYQGSHTTVRVDHEQHAMFVKISPLGGLIWIVVLAFRLGVRYVTGGLQPAMSGDPHAAVAATSGPAGLLSTALLVLAVGIVFGLRAYLQRVYSVERVKL